MKRALVISGGGSKGAFAVGILQQLKSLFPQLHFDMIVGTSTGALITPLAALEELEELEQLYTTQTTDKIVTTHRLGDRINEKSVYTVEPLWQRIQETVTDERYNQILQSGTEVYLVTTCLQTSESTVYTTAITPKPVTGYVLKKIADAGHLRLAVLASACQPVVMTPVKIDAAYATGPEKDFQYVDGGVREYAGVQMAIDQGATEIFCILLSALEANQTPVAYESLFPILQRTLDIFEEDVQKNDLVIPQLYASALRYIERVKQKLKADGMAQDKIDRYFSDTTTPEIFNAGAPVKLFIIRPQTPLGGGPGGLVFNPAEMKVMLQRGQQAAEAFANNLPPGDKTWLA